MSRLGILPLAALLTTFAAPAAAQRAQWTDAVYVPGRWTAGRLVPAPTANQATDSLALVMRVDYFVSAPRWRAEIRRSTDGEALADAPDVIIGNAGTAVVITAVGTTPFTSHALNRDALARAALAAVDAGGRRVGAASGRLVERDAAGKVGRVVFRRSARSAAFDDAMLNPGAPAAGRSLLASNLRAVGDQRGASVVATAGARGVDRVNTPSGSVPVHPDSAAIRRMEAYRLGGGALEDFLRRGRLGPYASRDTVRRP